MKREAKHSKHDERYMPRGCNPDVNWRRCASHEGNFVVAAGVSLIPAVVSSDIEPKYKYKTLVSIKKDEEKKQIRT
jgi:hypothetical protein